jgi:hypothetical protein
MAANIITTAASGIGSLIQILGGVIGHHNRASEQISNLIGELKAAAAGADWTQVVTFSNLIIGVQGASHAVMDEARNIAKAASSAIALAQSQQLGQGPGTPPAQAAIAIMAAQQLVLTQVASLEAQLTRENASIWSHLWHAHQYATAGKA